MKKYIFSLLALFTCFMFMGSTNALTDAELPAITKLSITVDDKEAEQINGFKSENNLYYVELTEFCATYSSLCKYNGNDDTIIRYVVDKEYSEDTILFEIQISNLQYNTTSASTIGIITISGTSYVMGTTLLDSPIYKTDTGKVYTSVRFLAEGLGCSTAITEGAIVIDSDGYNRQTLEGKNVEVMYLNSETLIKSVAPLVYSKESKKYSITLPESEKENSTNELAFNNYRWIINNGEAYNYNAYKNAILPTAEEPFTIAFSIKQPNINFWGYVLVEVKYVPNNEFMNMYSSGDTANNYVTCIYQEEKETDPNKMTMVHVGTTAKTDTQSITIETKAGDKKEFCSSCTYGFITYYKEPTRKEECPQTMYYTVDANDTGLGLFNSEEGTTKYILTDATSTSGAEFTCKETCSLITEVPYGFIEKKYLQLVEEIEDNNCYCKVTK